MSSEENMKRMARQMQTGPLAGKRQRGVGGKLRPLAPVEIAPTDRKGVYSVQEPEHAQVYTVTVDGESLSSEPELPSRLLLAVRTRLGLHG